VKRNIRTAWGMTGVLAFGSIAAAQQPGAVLLPVRASEPASIVARGATPYAPFNQIPQAPADSVPATRGGGTAANPQSSWVSRQWNNTVDFVGGKGDAKPYAPFPSMDAKPQANPPANAKAPPTRSPNNPTMIQPTAAIQTSSVPQGVYAGPPAYRWYGWGSTTPGANPHSPTGIYPKASAAWYSQTGATPGAFPIPVTYPRRENTAEPPVYVGGPNPNAIEATGRIVIAELPRSQTPAPVPYPEYPVATAAPAMPQGTPMPIASNPAPAMMPAPAPAPAVPSPPAWPTEVPANKPTPVFNTTASSDAELNWTAAKAPAVAPNPAPATVMPPPMSVAPPSMPTLTPPPAMPMPTKEIVAPPTLAPVAPQTPVTMPKVAPEQAWKKPKSTPGHTGIVTASANFVTPMPTTHDSIALEQAIRNACPKTVKKIEINRIGGNGLVIRFVVDAEAHAQEAATAIADLIELKNLDVRYEALLLAK